MRPAVKCYFLTAGHFCITDFERKEGEHEL